MAEQLFVSVLIDIALCLVNANELSVVLAAPSVRTVVNVWVDARISHSLLKEVHNEACERKQTHVLDTRDLLGRYLLLDSHVCKFKFIINYNKRIAS